MSETIQIPKGWKLNKLDDVCKKILYLIIPFLIETYLWKKYLKFEYIWQAINNIPITLFCHFLLVLHALNIYNWYYLLLDGLYL